VSHSALVVVVSQSGGLKGLGLGVKLGLETTISGNVSSPTAGFAPLRYYITLSEQT